MKKLSDVEQMLLDTASIDELIKLKMEKALYEETKQETLKEKTLTDIKDVPQDLVFSKHAVYKLFNRNTKMETYISGIQAEGLLGLQTSIRERIKNREQDSFSTENAYVKFHYIKING